MSNTHTHIHARFQTETPVLFIYLINVKQTEFMHIEGTSHTFYATVVRKHWATVGRI